MMKEMVAIKIVRALDQYYEAAVCETETMLILRDKFGDGAGVHLLSMRGHFDHGRHRCLVFPLCGATLLELLKSNARLGKAGNLASASS